MGLTMSSGFFDWRDLPFPVSWHEILGSQGPLFVEIGFGSGEFMAWLLERHPEAAVVGFEVSEGSIRRALRRLEKVSGAHYALLHMDARAGLRHLFSPASIDRIFVNFPDPWPKKRHEKRRLFYPPFWALVASRLKLGGSLQLYTDEISYLFWVLEQSQEVPELEVHWEATRSYPKTRYAQKWESAHKEIYRLEAVKVREAPYNFPCLPKDEAMPNVVLKPREGQTLSALVQGIGPLKTTGGIDLIIPKAYLSIDGQEALFEVFLKEQGLDQRYFIVVRRMGEKIVVRIHDATRVAVTPGVKMSVRLIGDQLQRRGCELLQSTVEVIR